MYQTVYLIRPIRMVQIKVLYMQPIIECWWNWYVQAHGAYSQLTIYTNTMYVEQTLFDLPQRLILNDVCRIHVFASSGKRITRKDWNRKSKNPLFKPLLALKVQLANKWLHLYNSCD